MKIKVFTNIIAAALALSVFRPVAYAEGVCTAEINLEKSITITAPETAGDDPLVVWVTRNDEVLWADMYSKGEYENVEFNLPSLTIGDTVSVELSGAHNESIILNYDEKLVFDDFKKRFYLAKESEIVSLITNAEYSTYITAVNISTVSGLRDAKLTVFLNTVINGRFGNFSEISALIDQGVAAALSYREPESNGSSGGGGGITISADSKPETVTVQEVNEQTVEESLRNNQEIIFTDLETSKWAEESIMMLTKLGVVSGVGNGLFEPNRGITRAEFLKMIFTVYDECDDANVCSFTDVSQDKWYYPYIAGAQSLGLVSGNENGEFRPDDYITRQDVATLIWRFATFYKKLPDIVRTETRFDDSAKIDDYAKESITELYTRGVINGMGNGCFEPEIICNRAMAAKLITGVIL